MTVGPFAHRDFRLLFSAQIVALLGTGLTTVALGLLAYELAGPSAAVVLGTALTIKMVLYVVIAPIAAAYVDRLPRRAFLVALDVVRAGVVLALPFVTEVWQVYVLVGVLQAASAAFTPTFQAVIPDIITDEREYTTALSASQVAYTIESLVSPVLAALALLLIDFDVLFVGTAIGFVASALLVLRATVPDARTAPTGGPADRILAGAVLMAAADTPSWALTAVVWFASGAGSAMAITPTGKVLRAAAAPSDVAAVFAAQFSLSHLAWLVAYPIAGWGATRFGLVPAWALLAAIAAAGAILAPALWRRAPAEVTVGATVPARSGGHAGEHQHDLAPGSPAWRHTAAAGGTLTECQCTCGQAA